MYGSHLSIAGGLHNALLEARKLRMDCVQVFTKNQRQWTAKPLSDEDIDQWLTHRQSTGIADVVSHDSYLINLASPDAALLDKSINLFRDELLRCEALQIAHLVTHPGAHVGSGEDAGLASVAKSLDRLHADLPGLKTVTCLEITAGQGSGLGYSFEHLRRIMDMVADPARLGVCLDTAHMIAAGYDLTSAKGAKAVLDELDNVVGIRHVRVVHVNDSKVPRGSRVDRHEHIGKGHVSKDAFHVILTHPHLAKVPKILETAKGLSPGGRNLDSINLAALRKIAARTL